MPIRQARADDIENLAALDIAVFGAPAYPDFFFRQAIALWPQLVWLAESEQQELLAYVLGAPASESGEGWVLSLGVSAQARGQGLGEQLSRQLLAQMQQAGFASCQLTVAPDNLGARRLYQRLGFVDSVLHPDYFGPGQARIEMKYTFKSK